MTVTDELCRLLDERRVEYFTNDDERAYDEPARTTWDFVLCGYKMTVTATEFVDIEGKTYLEMDFHHAFTPEQAIDATLGNPDTTSSQEAIVRSFLRNISPNRDWDYLGEHEHALIADLVDAVAATLGHSTLTAEQVREAIFNGSAYASYDGAQYYANGIDMQTIADELNATLRGRTEDA